MDLLERVADQLFRATRIDVAFLKTIWPEREIATLGSYLASLTSLGFVSRGEPTNALRSLARHSRESKEWNDIVRERFIRTYAPAFGTLDVLSVGPEDAREALTMRGGRSGSSVKNAIRFFLNGAEELRDSGVSEGSSGEEARSESRWEDPREMHHETSSSLPYIKWSNFNELLLRLGKRKSLPHELTPTVLHETMPRLKVSTHSHYRHALGSLGLIDNSSRPTPALRALLRCAHDSTEWRAMLREILAHSYGRALGFADAIGVDDETAERRILDWTGFSSRSAKTSLRFLRAALRDTRPDPVRARRRSEPELAEPLEYAVHKLPWHGRSDPFVVKVPFDLKKAEWRWVDGYVRRWISGAWKEQRE